MLWVRKICRAVLAELSLIVLGRSEGYVDQSLRREVDRCLKALFAGVGDDVYLDGNGMVTLAFEGAFEITLEVPAHGATAYAHAAVARMPIVSPEAAMRRALEINLFRLHRPNMWIALDAETSTLTLCATLAGTEVEASALGAFLEDILQSVRGLQEALAPEHPPERMPSAHPSDAILIRG